MIDQVIHFYAKKYFVDVIRMANVSNHLHLQIKLRKRHFYFHFIRVVTGVIAKKMARLGASEKFWDSRPFTRIAIGLRAFLGLQDYIAVNILEGMGASRETATWLVNRAKSFSVAYGLG